MALTLRSRVMTLRSRVKKTDAGWSFINFKFKVQENTRAIHVWLNVKDILSLYRKHQKFLLEKPNWCKKSTTTKTKGGDLLLLCKTKQTSRLWNSLSCRLVLDLYVMFMNVIFDIGESLINYWTWTCSCDIYTERNFCYFKSVELMLVHGIGWSVMRLEITRITVNLRPLHISAEAFD